MSAILASSTSAAVSMPQERSTAQRAGPMLASLAARCGSLPDSAPAARPRVQALRKRTDARLTLGDKASRSFFSRLDRRAQIGHVRRIRLGKPGRCGPAPGGIGCAPSAPSLSAANMRWQAATQPVDHMLCDDHDPNGSEDGELCPVIGELSCDLAP